MDNFLYYVEDTSWSEDKKNAKKFKTKEESIDESDRQKLYEILVEEV